MGFGDVEVLHAKDSVLLIMHRGPFKKALRLDFSPEGARGLSRLLAQAAQQATKLADGKS